MRTRPFLLMLRGCDMTEKQLAGYQRRSLRTMRQRLLNMAADWDGLDQFNMGELENLADRVEEIAISLADHTADETEV